MRHRYIAVKVDIEQNVDRRDLISAVSASLLKLFGEYGSSLAELSLVDLDPEGKYAIFRCTHRTLEIVKASIVALGEINGKKAATQVINVSGTLKALRKRLLT